MASIVKVDQLQGLTSSTITDINDLAFQVSPAWVTFNGTGTVAIKDSYNVSSITDNATGDYTVNYTNALSYVDYTVFVCSSAQTNWIRTGAFEPSTTAVQVGTGNSSGTSADNSHVCVTIMGGF